MRKDASSLREWEMSPTDPNIIGHAKSAFWDVNRACERWLIKRGMGVSYRHAFYCRPQPAQDAAQADATLKKRVRAKYATDEERKQARSEMAKAQWANMSPETREKRIWKSNSLRKYDAPRWQRDDVKEYKREWEKRKRERVTLTDEQIKQRRQRSRELYQKYKQSPEFREKRKASKDKYRERLKAKKAASV
jgi:hypothetical protein